MKLVIKGIEEAQAAIAKKLLESNLEGCTFELLDDNDKIVDKYEAWKASVPTCPGPNKWATAPAPQPAPAKPALAKTANVTLSLSASGGEKHCWAATLSSGSNKAELKGETESGSADFNALTGFLTALRKIKFKVNLTLQSDTNVAHAIEKGWLRKWEQDNWSADIKNKELWQQVAAELHRVCDKKLNIVSAQQAPNYDEPAIEEMMADLVMPEPLKEI